MFSVLKKSIFWWWRKFNRLLQLTVKKLVTMEPYRRLWEDRFHELYLQGTQDRGSQRRRGYVCMEEKFRDDFSEEVAFELGFEG